MKTCTRVSIGLLLGIVLIVVSGDTAAQTADPSSGGRRGEFLGLSPSQAKELRRKLESTIRERAVLESVHTVEIRSEVAGSMTILRLVPEASVVKKGDLLVQLDGSSLQEEMLKQRAAVAQARAALRQIELANAVADQQRTNGVAVAKLAAKVAELDRNKYLAKGGEFELALKKIETQITSAERDDRLVRPFSRQAQGWCSIRLCLEQLKSRTRSPQAEGDLKTPAIDVWVLEIIGPLRKHAGPAREGYYNQSYSGPSRLFHAIRKFSRSNHHG